jgi:hypothetical protein
LVENCGGHLARIELKNLKLDSSNTKPAATLEQGQRILANMIAGAYLRRTRIESGLKGRFDNTKDKEV